MTTSIFQRASLGTLACAMLLLAAGCATTVAISARFPARYAETTDIRRVAIAGFGGFGGNEFGSALQAELVSATFDGKPYFTVVATGGPNDPGRASGYGRSVGAQGVILGTISTDFNTQTYQGSESRCVLREDNKCKKYQSFAIACWRRSVDVVVVPRLVKVANGQLIYSSQKTARKNTSWCQGQSQSTSDLSLVTAAHRDILGEIRRDIAPYNAVLSATLKTKGEGLSKEIKPQFASAVKAATDGAMGEACRIWGEVNTASPNNVDTVYDLGVCAESEGAYAKALGLYRQAQSLGTASDRDVVASIARAQNLMQANGQLAQEESKRAAVVQAERDRAAAEQRDDAARSAQAARSRQAAATAAKAAQDSKRRAVTAKYGPGAAEAILSGKVVKGMTKDQVIAARGKPSQVRTLGPGEEMWSYGAQRIVFLGGRVSSVR